jgi:hypothetical protein
VSTDNAVNATQQPAGARAAAAADAMYRAELALHAARQADMDAWVAAAYERLHEAIAEHLAATAAQPA